MRLAFPLSLSAVLLGACLPTITAVDSGPLTLNSPCVPFLDVDPCMSWGYVCAAVGTGYSCQYPEYGDDCLPSVGCDPDAGQLSCDAFDGGPQALSPACGTPCDVPTDCLDSNSTCYPAYLPDGGFLRACAPNYCANAFAACPVSDSESNGTCLPLSQYPVCQQTGPVGPGGLCTAAPVDGGAYLCQEYEQCSSGNSGTVDVCFALCGGGMPCQGSTVCVAGYLCLAPCNTSSPDCTSPLTCQNLLDGQGADLGSYCTPP